MPESDPEDTPVRMSAERSMVMVPDASANRPVPPVMVWVSVIVTVGNTTMSPCPTRLTRISSPFAAVHKAVPVAFPVAMMTVKSALRVNRPRCEALPVPSRCLTALASSPETTCSVACSVPLNGNAEPPRASVAAAPLTALDADVGAVGTWPPHAASKDTHTEYDVSHCGNLSRSVGRGRGMFVLEHLPYERAFYAHTESSDVRNCTEGRIPAGRTNGPCSWRVSFRSVQRCKVQRHEFGNKAYLASR